MKRFGLTDIQAQAILDMRLKTLSGLQREKIEEEYKQLMELIAHLRAILASEKLVFDIIKEELIEIRDKFEDVEQSINTNHPYTHYHLAIPNADCQLTMSGNYRLTVYDDNAEND